MAIVDVVAGNVRFWVARRGLPRSAVAEVLAVSSDTVNARMAGRVPFTVRELVVLSALLQIPPASLLEGVEGESS